jgi:hypothetical protein
MMNTTLNTGHINNIGDFPSISDNKDLLYASLPSQPYIGSPSTVVYHPPHISSTLISLERESVKILNECIDLQLRKSQDYQNPNSNVTQAMHYRRGIDTIHDTLQGKLYRAQSLLESDRPDSANYESLEDTYKDLINYASFAVAWLRGKIPGQSAELDIFNKKKINV